MINAKGLETKVFGETEYYKLKPLCRAMGLRASAFYYLCETGNQIRKMEHLKDGCHWFIKASEVTEYPFITSGGAKVRKVYKYNENLERYEWGYYIIRTKELVKGDKNGI